MKTSLRILLAGVIFTAAQGILRADAGYSFSFDLAQKHEAGKTTAGKGDTVKTQNWSYAVTMENKSFKDVPDIEIKYVMFSKPDLAGKAVKGGQHPSLQRHEGTVSIKLLRNNDSVTFNTDSVLLRDVELNSGWYWASGASPSARGALRGLWIRVYVGGQQVAEYMDPPELSSNESFDAPAKN